jgi:hypothetical protein
MTNLALKRAMKEECFIRVLYAGNFTAWDI